MKKIHSLSAEDKISSAISFYEKGNIKSAKKILEACTLESPNEFDVFRILGFIAGQQQDFKKAAQYLERAVALRPTFVEGWYYLAKSFVQLKMFEKSIRYFDTAIQLFPQFFEALHDKGLALYEMRRFDDAILSFNAACLINPYSPEAWTNLAATFREKDDFTSTIECYKRLLMLTPKNLIALEQLAHAYAITRQHAESIKIYERILVEKPNAENIKGFLFNAKLFVADWSTFEEDKQLLRKEVREGKPCIVPFIATAIFESSEELLRVAKRSADGYRRPAIGPFAPKGGERKIIKLAYLSADFHGHATTVLIMDLIKNHDRSKFWVVGISFGQDQSGELAKEIRVAFDQFIDVRNKSDEEVAHLLRELDVDIAVDLKGYTHNSRPAILAYRPAPIQVNYLGFPGTMGASHIDYVIADKFVIPESDETFYTESVVVLPDTYQPNGKNRTSGKQVPTREELGLPSSGIVFCSFNSPHKTNPMMFEIWMNLLKQVDHSSLWVMSGSAAFEANIRMEATLRDVAPSRIIFAKHVPLTEHLARISRADIFLDSLPYGAHTTASDALWANVPVVTCVGNTFPGRVGQSVLQALEMPELIAYSVSEYFELALKLATDQEALQTTRQKLAIKVQASPLFNAERYAAHLECAYREMVKTYEAGLAPAKIVVPAGIR